MNDRPFAEALWKLLSAVRRRERGRFLFFAGIYALLTLSQTLGLVASEALFLAELGAKKLPETFILASAVTVAGMFGYAAIVGRTRNDRLFIAMLLISALGLAGLFLLTGSGPGVLVALLCGFFLTQAVFVTHFRTFATDYFDTVQAKRLFPLFAVGSSLGGVVGGGLAVGLSEAVSSRSLIVAWALGLVAAAALLRAGKSSLRRWAPLDLEEADESSTGGLIAALRFLQRDALSRWLAASIVGMVFALFLMQYVYLDIFERSFESAEALATFIGVYLTLSNVVEILLEVKVTPWLLRRFGVAQANLLHPVLTLATFGLLAVEPRLYAAVLGRANRELVESALAGEVRNLSYNALPFRFRGSIRAFLEGVLFYGAMSIAGVVLLALEGQLQIRWLCAVGALATCVYFGANLRVRREYLQSMVEELRKGRLDLDEVSADLGSAVVAELATTWERELRQEVPTRAMLQVAPLLVRRGFAEPVHRASQHASARVRRACLAALASRPDAALDTRLLEALEDHDARVRLEATRAAAALDGFSPGLRGALQARLRDRDPQVCAEAALRLGAEGIPALRALATSPDPVAACAALERLPDAEANLAYTRLDDDDPGVRAAAIETLARTHDSALSTVRLLDDLEHDDERVRRAAVQALGALRDPSTSAALARKLDDPARGVRREAAAALAGLGTSGVEAALPFVSGTRRWTVDAALETLARTRSPEARRALEQAFRDRVVEAWKALLALAVLSRAEAASHSFLAVALGNRLARSHWLAFRILELLEDPSVVRSVRKNLQLASVRSRSDALEILTHLGDRDSAELLALLHEAGPLEEKVVAVASLLPPPESYDDIVRDARDSSDRWLRIAACLNDPESKGSEEVKIMESLLALRNVSLFAHLTLEQLETIHHMMREARYLAGETLVREGDAGDELFVLIEGEVEAYRDYGTDRERRVNIMRPPSYFGEIAVLDSSARTATLVVSRDATLLRLGGEHFRELILQSPEISFDIFHMLCDRIRDAEYRAGLVAHAPQAETGSTP